MHVLLTVTGRLQGGSKPGKSWQILKKLCEYSDSVQDRHRSGIGFRNKLVCYPATLYSVLVLLRQVIWL